MDKKIKYLLAGIGFLTLLFVGFLFIIGNLNSDSHILSTEEIKQGLQECLPMSDMESKKKCDELLAKINDFDACVAVGFEISKSNPPQCRSADGRVFFEEREVILNKFLPTNFSEIGVITFDNPGQEQGTGYLIYEKPGQAALNVKLQFDEDSMLVASANAMPVVALSASPDMIFGGKRFAVEGIKINDTVLVKKIREIKTGEITSAGNTGIIYISWGDAMSLVASCQVDEFSQSHKLDVDMTLKTGERIRTVEPKIDEVFNVRENIRDKCGEIPLGTE